MELIKSTLKLMISRKMMYFNMQLAFTGISISYWSGLISPIIVYQLNNDPNYMDLNLSQEEQDQKALIAMISFGFGEVAGGVLQGWFIDTFSSKRASILNLVIIIIMIAVSIGSIASARYDFVTFFMTFMWGLQDGTINTHVYQVLGSEFETHSEPFGVFNFVQGLAVFIFQMIQSVIDSESKSQLIVYTCVVGVLGVLTTVSSYNLPFKSLVKNQVDERVKLMEKFPEEVAKSRNSEQYGSMRDGHGLVVNYSEVRPSSFKYETSQRDGSVPRDSMRDSTQLSYPAVVEEIE